MPERQSPVPLMRASTGRERVTDTLRDLAGSAAAQPLAQLLDALGFTNLAGWEERFTDPDAPGVEISPLIGMAKGPTRMPRRVNVPSDARHAELLAKFGGTQGRAPRTPPAPRIGGAGPRIESNSQAGVGTPEANMAKIPRFRSPLGTFIKHEGEWWRIKEQPAGNVYNRGEQGVVLELLPPGVPEPGTVPKVLQTKVISADELIEGIRKAKGVTEPQGMVPPRGLGRKK